MSASSNTLASVSVTRLWLRDRVDAAFPYLLTLLFFGLTLWGILHHEMWRDEVQAWLVARDSNSLVDIVHNVRYERTPALWHLSLRALTYLTDNPIAMQLFHLVVATTSIFLFVKYSPFTKLQRILFSFGYFSFYEYAVISRSYALGVLLVIVTSILLSRPTRNYLMISIVLGLLANTSVYGLLLTMAFALFVACELLIQFIKTRITPPKKVLLAATLLFGVSVALCVFQLSPPADYALPDPVRVIPVAKRDSLAGSFLPVFSSYVAVPNVLVYRHWCTNIIDALPVLIARRVSVFTALVLFASAVILLLRRPTVLVMFVAGTGALLWFSATFFHGTIRHHGHLFILLIACFWLSSSSKANIEFSLPWLQGFLRRYKVVYLNTILAAQLIGGVFAMVADWRNPFSETRKTAEFIQERLTPATVFAGHSFLASPMTAYLDVKVYMVDRLTFGTFMIWDRQSTDLRSDDRKFQVLTKLLDGQTREVLFVHRAPFNPNAKGFEVTKLAEFNHSFNSDLFYVYRIRHEGDGFPAQFSQNIQPGATSASAK